MIQAAAEFLPVASQSFDASLAILTIHHWADWRAGLRELRRVARRCVVLTFDPSAHNQLWLLRNYLPEALATPAVVHAPPVTEVAAQLGTEQVESILVPHDCSDGFGWAYWRRPELDLDRDAAGSISVLAQLPRPSLEAGLSRLAQDLRSGQWHDRYDHLLELEAIDGGFRLIVSDNTTPSSLMTPDR